MSFAFRNILLIALAVAAAAWSYNVMLNTADDVAAAKERATKCHSVAAAIQETRAVLSPDHLLAAGQFDPTPALSRIFRESGAKVDSSFTVTVTPQPIAGMPFNKTGLVIMPTQTMTLKNLVTLLEKLHSSPIRFNVAKITLSAPRSGSPPKTEAAETWQADFEISFLEHASTP